MIDSMLLKEDRKRITRFIKQMALEVLSLEEYLRIKASGR
jgi:hypothetical protein